MGIIGTLLTLARGKLALKGNAPGKSAVINGEGFEGQTITTEVYQAPGVFGIPADGTKGVWIPLGGSSRYGVVIAINNYQVELDVGGPGGMAIHSTTSDGKTIKASVICKPDGKILVSGDSVEINGNGKRFVTWDELNTALQAHTHAAGTLLAPNGPVTGATGGPVGLDLTAAKTSTVKTGG